MDPTMIIAAAAQKSAGTIQGGLKAFQGFRQLRQGRRALAELEGKDPAIEISAGTRQLMNEPISEQLLNIRQENEARRLAMSTGALSKGGDRAVIAGINKVVDDSRLADNQIIEMGENARRRAIENYSAEERDVQKRKMADYLGRLQAARGLTEAGQQNLMTAAGDYFGGTADAVGTVVQGGAEQDALSTAINGMG